MDKKINIFIFSHKQIASSFIHKPEYKYVQCNAVTGHLQNFDLFDDEKNPIYDLNWCFSEATGISRIIYDEQLIQSLDYIGFGQYRRYLEYSNVDLNPNRIICQSIDFKKPVIYQYLLCHYSDVYSFFMKNIYNFDLNLYKSINDYFNNSTLFYRANCFITSLKIFSEYCEFMKKIFPILENIVRNDYIRIDQYDNYQKRYMSFLFERLTSYWIYTQMNSGVDIHNSNLFDLPIPNTENGTR